MRRFPPPTGRNRSSTPGTLSKINDLEPSQVTGQKAVDLLTTYAGAVRTGDEPEAVREVVRICEGLPLALQLAGGWLASQPDVPVSTFATRLAQRPLDGLDTEHQSIRDTLTETLRAVAAEDPLATKVFPLLADGNPHSPEQVAQTLGEDPSRVFFTLERLVGRWLIESPQPEQYHTTGLRRAYATELASHS